MTKSQRLFSLIWHGMAIGRSITKLIYTLHWLWLLHGCQLADWPWNELHGSFCFHTVNKSLTWLFFLRMLLTWLHWLCVLHGCCNWPPSFSFFFLWLCVDLCQILRCTCCSLILNALVITEYVKPSHFTNFHDIGLQHSTPLSKYYKSLLNSTI